MMGSGNRAAFAACAVLAFATAARGAPAGEESAVRGRVATMRNEDRIRPCAENPWYWQYNGRPVLLLGGSVEDNLFQVPDLEGQLDLLVSAGGNYIRNTMSDRDDGNARAFRRLDDGRYDLEQWGADYWERFATMLRLTAERDIIVQIEVWDRFDHSRDQWQGDPFNPKNNINYTYAESGFREDYPSHPGRNEQPFFHTVPVLSDNPRVRRYQERFVERMLEHTLPYGHVLYCMDNETSDSPEWSTYWAAFIREKARAAGAEVFLTEMWDSHDINHPTHERTWKHPELYDFCDVSQNNHRKGREHWDNLARFRERIAATGRIRPINCVKIYGADGGPFGNDRDAQERFWRLIFGGTASARFHRPTAGIGLSQPAQAHLRGMRMLAEEMDLLAAVPSQGLLEGADGNEAYCTAISGTAYAVFFPGGGEVLLRVGGGVGSRVAVRTLDILNAAWMESVELPVADGNVALAVPEDAAFRVILVRPRD